MKMPSLKVLALAGATATALLGLAAPAAAQKLLIAEPGHSLGYLPLYVAMHKGYFAEEKLDVAVTTLEGGSAHTNAVLTKQAFAFIGGPEHNAFAKAKGAELRAVANVVDRGNVYLVARAGLEPPKSSAEIPAWIKGKTIATSLLGGTPNSITRYLAAKWGLKLGTDIPVQEATTAAIMAAVKTKAADVGVISEPFLTQGIKQGFWGEPFLNVPVELGPYAYSTINIRKESIDKEPAVVRGFVKAISKGLRYTYAHPDEAVAIAKKEFPTMPEADLKATIDRAFADKLWSADGTISQQAWTTGKTVVMEAGMLKTDVPYDAIIDMSFIEQVRAAL